MSQPNELQPVEIEKIHAEIAKLIAETGKLNRESRWYPVVVASGLLGAGAGIAAILIKLI
jgi:hypothetical protein